MLESPTCRVVLCAECCTYVGSTQKIPLQQPQEETNLCKDENSNRDSPLKRALIRGDCVNDAEFSSLAGGALRDEGTASFAWHALVTMLVYTGR